MSRIGNRRQLRLLTTVVIILILLLVVPTIIVGELIYSVSRASDYEDLKGFKSVKVQTSDDVEIQTWYTNNFSKAVLIVHGHGDHSAIIQQRYGSIFRHLNYDQVYLDLRNHGRSEHHPPVTMGIEEREDVIAVLNWMSTEGWSEIILMGTSMGSIAAILALDETNVVDKLVVDSSFNDPIDTMNRNFEKNYIVQPWRFLIVWYLTKLRHEIDTFPDILTIIDNLNIPTLVAHGSSDAEASPNFLLYVDQLENKNVSTILIPGGHHSRLHLHEEFVTAVVDLVQSPEEGTQ